MKIKVPSEKAMLLISYFWLAFPFVIFLFGWTKLFFAIPVSIVVIGIIVINLKQKWKTMELFRIHKNDIISIIFIVFCVLIWIILSGIGQRYWQNFDHFFRNEIFRLLISSDWPVICENDGGEYSQLTYYFGFWLPAALVGKIFGYEAGKIFLIVWAFIGIGSVYYWICYARKKIQFWPLLIIIGFSGLDIVGQLITENACIARWHIEFWLPNIQYSSITSQLFWVYNQSIPIWLVCILFWVFKNKEDIVFLLGMATISTVFPVVGFLMIIACSFILNIRNLKKTVKAYVSFSNFVGAILGVVIYTFLRNNYSGQNVRLVSFDARTMVRVFIFLVVEIGAYIYICRKNRWMEMYKSIMLVVIIIPFIEAGNSCDFVMRASIPAIFFLCMFFIEHIDFLSSKGDKRCVVCILIWLIGMVTPFLEIKRSIYYQEIASDRGQKVVTEQVLLNYPVYFGDGKVDSIIWKSKLHMFSDIDFRLSDGENEHFVGESYDCLYGGRWIAEKAQIEINALVEDDIEMKVECASLIPLDMEVLVNNVPVGTITVTQEKKNYKIFLYKECLGAYTNYIEFVPSEVYELGGNEVSVYFDTIQLSTVSE